MLIMEDKETQIAKMANDLAENLRLCAGVKLLGHQVETIAYELLKKYQPKLPKNSVVISREEYERLSSSHDIVFCDNKDCSSNLLCKCCEISECPKNIPEYNEKLSANKYKLELFQKLCKERERADSWEDRYKLLQEELKQERKEIAEKFYKKYLCNILSLEAKEEFTKQFGVKINNSNSFNIDEFNKGYAQGIKDLKNSKRC